MTTKIVVGVDGSGGSVTALQWALDEAALRGATVVLVHAWQYPYVGEVASMAFPVGESELYDAATATIDHALASVSPLPAGVSVERHVVRGGAAPALLELAQDADLLVVGSRGHGGFAGLLLGSVSQQCIHHAPCPVVVVPSAA